MAFDIKTSRPVEETLSVGESKPKKTKFDITTSQVISSGKDDLPDRMTTYNPQINQVKYIQPNKRNNPNELEINRDIEGQPVSVKEFVPDRVKSFVQPTKEIINKQDSTIYGDISGKEGLDRVLAFEGGFKPNKITKKQLFKKTPDGKFTGAYGLTLSDPIVKANITLDERRKGLTDERARELATKRYTVAQQEISDFIPNVDEQPQEVRALLADLNYNMGQPSLSNFTNFKEAIINKDYDRTADELKYKDGTKKTILSKYYKKTGRRAKWNYQTLKDLAKGTPAYTPPNNLLETLDNFLVPEASANPVWLYPQQEIIPPQEELKTELRKPEPPPKNAIEWALSLGRRVKRGELTEQDRSRALVDLVNKKYQYNLPLGERIQRIADDLQPATEAGIMPVIALWNRLRSIGVSQVLGEDWIPALVYGDKKVTDIPKVRDNSFIDNYKKTLKGALHVASLVHPQAKSLFNIVDNHIDKLTKEQVLGLIDLSVDVPGIILTGKGLQKVSAKIPAWKQARGARTAKEMNKISKEVASLKKGLTPEEVAVVEHKASWGEFGKKYGGKALKKLRAIEGKIRSIELGEPIKPSSQYAVSLFLPVPGKTLGKNTAKALGMTAEQLLKYTAGQIDQLPQQIISKLITKGYVKKTSEKAPKQPVKPTETGQGGEKVSKPTEPKAEKKAWQMTKEEGLQKAKVVGTKEWEKMNPNKDLRYPVENYIKSYENNFLGNHKKQIKQALSEGKKVPEEVLKDYPELAKKYSKKQQLNPKDYATKEEWVKANKKNELSLSKTGKPIMVKVYHGSPDARFAEEFDPNKKGYYPQLPEALPDNTEWISLNGEVGKGFRNKNSLGNTGVSFTDDYFTAKSYSDKPAYDYQNSVPMVLERFVTLKNPKVLDLKGEMWTLNLGDEVKKAIDNGHDGLIFKNIRDDYHPSDRAKPTNNIIVFDKDNIKNKTHLEAEWEKAHGVKEAKQDIKEGIKKQPKEKKVSNVGKVKGFKNHKGVSTDDIKNVRKDVEQAKKEGIAVVKTTSGKDKVVIRDSGFYAEKGFEDVPIRDIYSQTQAPHHMALMQDRYKKGGGFGLVYKKVWIPTKTAFANSVVEKKKLDKNFKGIVRNHKFAINKKNGNLLSDWLEGKQEIPEKHKKMVSEIRGYMDELRDRANNVRKSMNKKEIGYIKDYVPHLQETTLWNELIGNMGTISENFDFIVPNQAKNPFAMKRLKKEMDNPERNFFKLVDRYNSAIMKDLYITPAIENIKAYNSVLKNRELFRSAKYWDDYIRMGLLGKQHTLDRTLNIGELGRKGLKKWNDMLNKAFLTGKLAWNIATQPLSYITLTPMETTFRSAVSAVFKMFRKGIRQSVREKSLSVRIKANDVLSDAVGEGRDFQSRIYRSKIDKWNDMLSLIGSVEEQFLQETSYVAGLDIAKKLGYTGEDAHMFADLVAERTQSMYNKENRALILNSDISKAIFPFQSFAIELFNHVKEILTPRSGAMSMDMRQRLGKLIKLLIGVFLANQYSKMITGRKKTTVGSFVPFVGEYIDRGIAKAKGDYYGGGRSPISIIQQIDDLMKGSREYLKHGSLKRLRKMGINFGLAGLGLGGGGQINNVVDGIMADITGEVKSTSGQTTLFKVDDLLSKIKAPVFGVWSTKGGREYWDDKETRKDIRKLIKKAGLASTEKKFFQEVNKGLLKNYFGAETASGYERAFMKEKYQINGNIYATENINKFANMKDKDLNILLNTYTKKTKQNLTKKINKIRRQK